jgi:hypothetical protein
VIRMSIDICVTECKLQLNKVHGKSVMYDDQLKLDRILLFPICDVHRAEGSF